MPIYEYEHDQTAKECPKRFEVLQGPHDLPLVRCPECGQSCHRVFSTFSTGSHGRNLLSPKNLESHGFTQYERAGDGRYAKKFGEGPPTFQG